MKKNFLTYEPSGVYEVPVTVAKERVADVVNDAKNLKSFTRIEVRGRSDKFAGDYTVTAMLKDRRDVAWFKLKWI